MRKKRTICRAVLALALSLTMTVPALAADVPFSDIPPNTELCESAAYLSYHGITHGTGAGTFSPDAPVTARQWAVMLCRAYGVETTGDTWAELSQNSIAEACRKGWLSESAVLHPDTLLCRGVLYESALSAARILVYDSVLYEGGAALSDYENCLRVGRELQLCGEKDAVNELVTRGETAVLLHALLTRSFSVEAPAAPVTLVNAAGVHSNDYLLALRQVPEPVLDAFNRAGWTLRIDFDYLGALSERLNMSCVGATSYAGKTIYLADPSSTLHEFGHFLDGQLGFPEEHEELFQAEARVSGLRPYAKTNAREYFADCFAFWVVNSGDGQRTERFRNAAPQTWTYLERLAEKGWYI